MRINYIPARAGIAGGAFVSRWKTDNLSAGSSNANQLMLPLSESGTYNFTVDWGEGSTSQITQWNQAETTHTYPGAGTYTVTCTGVLTGWAFDDTGDKNKFLDISHFGMFNPGNQGRSFDGCINMNWTATDQMSLAGVTNLSRMFVNCVVFNADLSRWDVSKVTYFGGMFSICRAFTSDLSGWDMSSAEHTAQMFFGCESFTSDLSSWDVSHVTGMGWMFCDCHVFNTDLSGWDVSYVTDMSLMFMRAQLFNSDLSLWNVSQVTSMHWMFYYCDVFNSDLSAWDVGNVTDMNSMFSDNPLFTSDLSAWDVSKVTDMSQMFYDCPVFTSDLSGWDVSHVTDMYRMFKGATLFNCDLSGWDITGVTASVFEYTWDHGMIEMFEASGLSAANYSAILIGWALQSVHSDVHLGAGTIKYNPDAAASRAVLTGTPNNWVITDGGVTSGSGGGGGDYYVATTGSDSNDGSEGSPWLTIQYAADMVSVGKTVIVKDGIYTNTVPNYGSEIAIVKISCSGNSSEWITFKSENKGGAVLDGQNYNAMFGFLIEGLSYVKIEGFEIKNISQRGIDAVLGSNNLEFKNNHIHHIGRICTTIHNGLCAFDLTGVDNILLEGNVIHDIGRLAPNEGCSGADHYLWNDHGIYIDGVNNCVIRYNIFYNVFHGWPLHFYSGSNHSSGNISALNNTIAFNKTAAGLIVLYATLTNVNIQNNLLYMSADADLQEVDISSNYGIVINDGYAYSGVSINHNMMYRGNGIIAPARSGVTIADNFVNTDPLCINPTAFDFRLLSSSPAINAGVNVGLTTDIAGNPIVGNPDIGAYEYA